MPGSAPRPAAPPANTAGPTPTSPTHWSLPSAPSSNRSRPSPNRSPTNSPRTPMRTSSPACPDPERSEPQSFSPKSATAAADSPPPRHWHAWPASPPPPANRAPCVRSDSDGRATNTCATPSPTSPPTPAAPTPGPKTSTAALAPAATTTPTPCASWPAPGSTSSGTAGSTASATTRLNTAPSKHSCTTNNQPLDTGLLICTVCSSRKRSSPRPGVLFDEVDQHGDGLRLRHVTAVDDVRVVGGPQRRDRACRVQVVAPSHVGQHGCIVVTESGGDVLVV